MKYSRLGQSGLIVSRLGFGTMTFGTGNIPSVYKVSAKDADALVGHALDAGINFFDTADAYADGQSESMLGQALGARRQSVIVATKVGMRVGTALGDTGLSRRHIEASLASSLGRLGTDYVDLYLVHRFDPATPMEETLSCLDGLVQRGYVRYVGFSNWAAWQAAKAVGISKRNGWAAFVASQMYYSLVGRDIEHELLPMAMDAGIGTIVWGPLAGGFLSGKYATDTLKAPDNRLSGFDFLPFDKEMGFRLLVTMRGIAEEHSASIAQVALAWLLARPGVGSVLIGASKATQLQDNLRSVDLRLTTEQLNTLDEASPHHDYYPKWFTERLRDPQVANAVGV